MVNFPTRIRNCDSHSPALLHLFLFFDASICSTMDFPLLGNSDHVVKFPLTFHHIYKRILHCIAYDYSCVDWGGLRDHLRDVPWDDILKMNASAAASKFYEWIQTEIDVYIPNQKYQGKPHSSHCFSAACAAVIVYRITFFICTKSINVLNLK